MDKLKMQTANKTMTSAEKIKVFEDRKIRVQWDSDLEDWLLSVVDVVEILTDSRDYQTARKYWKVLKNRLKKEGSEPVTNCNQLKTGSDEPVTNCYRLKKKSGELVTKCNQLKLMSADGKYYFQDVLDTKGIYECGV